MNPEERKKQILLCAKKLLSENGYYKTQISDIVREADIARGTVYQYFKNKDDIFSTLIEDFYIKWEQSLSDNDAFSDLNKIKPEEYFKQRIKKTLVFFQGDNEMCNIVLRIGIGLHKEFDTIINKFEKKIFNFIIEDIKIGQHFNNIPMNIDTQLYTTILTGALFRVSYHYFVLHRDDTYSDDIDSLAEKIVNFFSPGLFPKK